MSTKKATKKIIINYLSIFPNLYKEFVSTSIVKKAIEKNILKVNIFDLRDFATGKYKKIDDEVYGGGRGMLLMVEPVDKALKKIKGYKILLSPQGKVFNQKIANKLSKMKKITFISGRYEGFDERIRNIVDEEISIGDYILLGGELPSMVITEAIIRLIPGVIQEESIKNESFQNNLLDFPQYTRPRVYKKMKVPDVLLNGNHLEILKWRKKQQVIKTLKKRKDLQKNRSKNEK